MAEYVSQESNEAEQNLLEADVQQEGVQRDITIRQELEFLNRRPASLATEPINQSQRNVQRDITAIRQELEFLNRRVASLATEPINQSQRNVQRDIAAIRWEMELLKRRVASVELTQRINQRPGGHPEVPVQPLPEL
jgi:regulatory protein YycI of two-component signal transduction system YycFG